MYISAPTLDDLLKRVLEKLVKSSCRITPTKGPATELTGVLLKLSFPRARLSRTEVKGTLFSCLGELLWYLAKTNDLSFILYYLKKYEEFSDDGRTVYGAYGPRLFAKRGQSQVSTVIKLLRKKNDSRQAVIQLFDAKDITKPRKDIPCTCTLQFMIRRGYLHMITNMRSNDAFVGLPHDIFAFTMLQEIMARTLGVEVGVYKHVVGSLHLYDNDREKALRYIKEGWQSTVSMPAMPQGDPWRAIRIVLQAEAQIREGQPFDVRESGLSHYWADLVRLLLIFKHSKDKNSTALTRTKKQMSSAIYNMYIQKRQTRNASPEAAPQQLPLV